MAKVLLFHWLPMILIIEEIPYLLILYMQPIQELIQFKHHHHQMHLFVCLVVLYPQWYNQCHHQTVHQPHPLVNLDDHQVHFCIRIMLDYWHCEINNYHQIKYNYFETITQNVYKL